MAAQEAVSRAVTGEETGAATPPVVEPEPPVTNDQVSEEGEGPDEEPPTSTPSIDIPDTLSEEVQLAETPTREEGEGGELFDVPDILDQSSPNEMIGENERHWIDEDPDLVTSSSGPFSPTPTGEDDISIEGGPNPDIESQMALAHE